MFGNCATTHRKGYVSPRHAIPVPRALQQRQAESKGADEDMTNIPKPKSKEIGTHRSDIGSCKDSQPDKSQQQIRITQLQGYNHTVLAQGWGAARYLLGDEPRGVPHGTEEASNSNKAGHQVFARYQASAATYTEIGSMMVKTTRGTVGREDAMAEREVTMADGEVTMANEGRIHERLAKGTDWDSRRPEICYHVQIVFLRDTASNDVILGLGRSRFILYGYMDGGIKVTPSRKTSSTPTLSIVPLYFVHGTSKQQQVSAEEQPDSPKTPKDTSAASSR